jgi:hypothetical protein
MRTASTGHYRISLLVRFKRRLISRPPSISSYPVDRLSHDETRSFEAKTIRRWYRCDTFVYVGRRMNYSIVSFGRDLIQEVVVSSRGAALPDVSLPASPSTGPRPIAATLLSEFVHKLNSEATEPPMLCIATGSLGSASLWRIALKVAILTQSNDAASTSLPVSGMTGSN